MKGVQQGREAQGLIGQMTIRGYVDREHKRREVHHHTSLQSTQKATTVLLKMSPKAVKRDCKARDVKCMVDKNLLAIKRCDGRATTQNWEEGVVTHSDLEILNRFVGDESRLFGN
jgi:hypothetical protein